MAHNIPITNGKGSLELVDGNYNVASIVPGYDDSTIDPVTIEVTEGVDEYSFTISATGTLVLHVSDDGTEIGVPIENATFSRCDSEGTPYGDPITSDVDGNATFNNVPFAEENAPVVYYKQTASDGEHTFDDTLKEVTLTEESTTIEISNPMAAARTINLTDAYYSGLPIASGEISLTE